MFIARSRIQKACGKQGDKEPTGPFAASCLLWRRPRPRKIVAALRRRLRGALPAKNRLYLKQFSSTAIISTWIESFQHGNTLDENTNEAP
jgi:hypothetical protein